MTRTRALLAALAATSLLLAACGDDDASDDPTIEIDQGSTDESTDDGGTDEEATDDEGMNVCALFTVEPTLIDQINEVTGEAFADTEQTDADTCELTDADDTAVLQLTVTVLDDDQTSEGFVADEAEACDPGSEVDVDVSGYAEAGYACAIDGEAAFAAVADGAAALLIGRPSDPTLTTEQVVTALDEIMQLIVSS